MRRLLSLFVVVLAMSAQGQPISRSFSDVPLPDVLIALDKADTCYAVNFIYDDLEDYTVTCDIHGKLLPEAIREAIGFYPMRITLGDSIIYVECTQKSARRLIGQVLDGAGRAVSYCNVSLLNPADSAVVASGVSNLNGRFVIPCDLPRVILRISHVGFQTLLREVDVGDVGVLRLPSSTSQLQPVVVTTDTVAASLREPLCGLAPEFARYATDVRRRVWGMKPVAESPSSASLEALRDSDVVVLMNYEEVDMLDEQRGTDGAAMFGLVGMAIAGPRLVVHRMRLHREQVLVNTDRGVRMMSCMPDYRRRMGMYEAASTIVGMRILKPDGRIVNVPTNAYCTSTRLSAKKKGVADTLFVPNLQPGDVLDYFYFNEDLDEQWTDKTSFDDGVAIQLPANTWLLPFFSPRPTLWRCYKLAFSSRFSVYSWPRNGAPEFQLTHDKEGNNILTAVVENVEQTLKGRKPYIKLRWAKAKRGSMEIVSNPDKR